MATEKEVILKVGTKPIPGADDGLKAIGRAARSAADANADLEKSATQVATGMGKINDATGKLTRSMTDYVKSTREAAAADREFARSKEALAAAVDRERAALEKNKALAAARKDAGLGGGRSGGGGGIPGMGFLGGASPFAAAGAGLAAVNNISGQIQSSGAAMAKGPWGKSGGDWGWGSDNLTHAMGEIPLFGHVMKSSSDYQGLERRQETIDSARQARDDMQARISTRDPFLAQQRGLTRQSQDVSNRLQFGSDSTRGQEAIGRQGYAAAVAGRARATGTIGYDRAAQQGDVTARIGFETSQRQQGVEQARQLQIIDAQRSQSADAIAKKQEEIGKLARAESIARKQLGAADQTEDQRQTRRAQLDNAILQTQEAMKQLEEEQARQKGLQVEAGDKLLQQGQQRVGLMQQERDRLAGIVQQEQQRRQSNQEQFGLQSPLARRTALNVARKISAGGELSERELQFAQSQGDLFKPAVQQIGRRRAGPEFEEINRLLGNDQRSQQAEQARVSLENKIAVEIKLNEAALADQLTLKLLPELAKAQAIAQQQMQAALERLAIQQRDSRGPLAGH